MSLDVYLRGDVEIPETEMKIFIRENGQQREISRKEWDDRFPGREPETCEAQRTELYWRNITHNLGEMAREAGIYQHLWRPEELGITKARELVAPLRNGLRELQSDPTKFKAFNPPNGWGDYDGLVAFVRDYLLACERNLDAEIYISR